MEQVPGLTSVTAPADAEAVNVLTVQTDCAVDRKPTARPELAVAISGTEPLPNATLLKVPKVIVCGVSITENDWVTGVATA